MQSFAAFDNNSDVQTNSLVAQRTGHKRGFEACERIFDERGVTKHKYRIFRQEVDKPWHPKTLTNIWGELENMGPFPWAFGIN
jgi:hypothetical protein